MSGSITYRGNCHCARYRFEVNLPEITSAISCDCLPCSKTGILWAFPAEQADFKVTRDDGLLTSTQYGGSLDHKFCSFCSSPVTGVHLSGPLEGRFGINVRALLGVNPFLLKNESSHHPDALTSTAATAAAAAATVATAPPQPADDDAPVIAGDGVKTYTGGCTCGAVAVALRTPPLPEVEVKEDNCSQCVRGAYVGVYPDRSQLTIVTAGGAGGGGTDGGDAAAASVYKTGPGFSGARFCRRCGVRVWSDLYGPPAELVATWPEARQAVVRRKLRLRPLNVRVLDGVEWDRLNVLRSDEGTEGYVVD